MVADLEGDGQTEIVYGSGADVYTYEWVGGAAVVKEGWPTRVDASGNGDDVEVCGIFQYFDALQVGLTATPVKFVERNTYQLFECADQDPTFNYEYGEAIRNDPPYLCPFRVVSVTTHFLRQGIKLSQMSAAQRAELEADIDNAEEVEFEQSQVDKQVFNKDANRVILRNLMDHGLRDPSGSRPGKGIVFARSHEHAKLLDESLRELYPQYGGSFCRIIDNYDPNAEALIDQFKDPRSDLTIAISVDKLQRLWGEIRGRVSTLLMKLRNQDPHESLAASLTRRAFSGRL